MTAILTQISGNGLHFFIDALCSLGWVKYETRAFLGCDGLVFLRKQSLYIYNQHNRSILLTKLIPCIVNLNMKSNSQCCALPWGRIYLKYQMRSNHCFVWVWYAKMAHTRNRDCDSSLINFRHIEFLNLVYNCAYFAGVV